MKTKNHYVYLLLFFFLAACGGTPTGEKAAEEVDEPRAKEAAAKPSGEIEELAKEFAELQCEVMQLMEKLMDGDAEAEARSEEISQRLNAIGERLEELVDEEDPDEVRTWELAFQKFWEQTDCN